VPGAEPIEEGKKFRLGNLQIDTRLTWGHSHGGMTYVVTGLARPIAIVGDSLFAGSMGGGNVSYRDALQNNLGKNPDVARRNHHLPRTRPDDNSGRREKT
jgi:hypothetical protein